MKIYSEISLENFEAWSGAKYAYNILTHEQLGELEQNLECIYPDGIDETELNDLFWFKEDTIAEWLGFEDWDELEHFNTSNKN